MISLTSYFKFNLCAWNFYRWVTRISTDNEEKYDISYMFCNKNFLNKMENTFIRLLQNFYTLNNVILWLPFFPIWFLSKLKQFYYIIFKIFCCIHFRLPWYILKLFFQSTFILYCKETILIRILITFSPIIIKK